VKAGTERKKESEQEKCATKEKLHNKNHQPKNETEFGVKVGGGGNAAGNTKWRQRGKTKTWTYDRRREKTRGGAEQKRPDNGKKYQEEDHSGKIGPGFVIPGESPVDTKGQGGDNKVFEETNKVKKGGGGEKGFIDERDAFPKKGGCWTGGEWSPDRMRKRGGMKSDKRGQKPGLTKPI